MLAAYLSSMASLSRLTASCEEFSATVRQEIRRCRSTNSFWILHSQSVQPGICDMIIYMINTKFGRFYVNHWYAGLVPSRLGGHAEVLAGEAGGGLVPRVGQRRHWHHGRVGQVGHGHRVHALLDQVIRVATCNGEHNQNQ